MAPTAALFACTLLASTLPTSRRSAEGQTTKQRKTLLGSLKKRSLTHSTQKTESKSHGRTRLVVGARQILTPDHTGVHNRVSRFGLLPER